MDSVQISGLEWAVAAARSGPEEPSASSLSPPQASAERSSRPRRWPGRGRQPSHQRALHPQVETGSLGHRAPHRRPSSGRRADRHFERGRAGADRRHEEEQVGRLREAEDVVEGGGDPEGEAAAAAARAGGPRSGSSDRSTGRTTERGHDKARKAIRPRPPILVHLAEVLVVEDPVGVHP